MKNDLGGLARLIRYYILESTTAAGSGHPSSSLSAVELMTVLMFVGFFRYNAGRPKFVNNDRLIFSKGHAAPLFYSLWAAAGKVSEAELLTLRKFGSRLEGHPTMSFPFTEVPTGSLGQGLSVGVGMALNAKYLDKLPYKTFVLLGDSELAEGSNWEAMQLASYYKLENLVGIVDVNRLGQRGETMLGHNVETYQRRIAAFGWDTVVVDGHSLAEVTAAFKRANEARTKPFMIIAKTIKGKGVALMENKNGWHGKALDKAQLKTALQKLGPVNKKLVGGLAAPKKQSAKRLGVKKVMPFTKYKLGSLVATRKAYGNALVRLGSEYPELVVLDAETSNSTHAEMFKEKFAHRFFEMFIAEQNMVNTAMGLSARGKMPFISTFAVFFSRAFDQIRMAQYANSNIKFCGSHAGVEIGEDGASQMGLEDIAMFRTILGSVVLYPCDAVSTEKLVEQAAAHQGMVYIRTTRKETPVIHDARDTFKIGGSHVLRHSSRDEITVIAAGITVWEALKAYTVLKKEGIRIRVIDLYSVKPLDEVTLKKAAQQTKVIVTVEDHVVAGGMGEAVQSALSEHPTPVISLAVRKTPHSGTAEQLLAYEGISSEAIVCVVRDLLSTRLRGLH